VSVALGTHAAWAATALPDALVQEATRIYVEMRLLGGAGHRLTKFHLGSNWPVREIVDECPLFADTVL
jgi:hypothetical protein